MCNTALQSLIRHITNLNINYSLLTKVFRKVSLFNLWLIKKYRNKSIKYHKMKLFSKSFKTKRQQVQTGEKGPWGIENEVNILPLKTAHGMLSRNC